MELSQFIRLSRQSLKLTQAEFAIFLKKSRVVVSKYETGLVTPPGDVVYKVFGVMFPQSICSLEEHHNRFSANLQSEQAGQPAPAA